MLLTEQDIQDNERRILAIPVVHVNLVGRAHDFWRSRYGVEIHR